MAHVDHPELDVQKKYWNDKWDWTRTQYPHDRAFRRGKMILNYIRSLNLERPRILDFGCGTGWFASQLAEIGPTTGIDLSEEAIRMARSHYPGVEFEAGDVYEVDLPVGCYDVVVSQEVVAHVPDQKTYIRRAADVLKPRGHLVISTPNPFVHRRNTWPPQPPGHIEQWLTRRALENLLEADFRVLKGMTVVPIGDKGILRLVNSVKATRALEALLSPERVEALKEWAGFGWTQILLAQKRA